ncbi:MAG: hypothetical protein EOP82_31160 [Variovorax sp.]|nr:MAG: hypothetical protein EOP82_31160 [Variovorax sp.]
MSFADDSHEELRDDVLRRALNHAPDMTAAPDWRLRKAILERAHDAVAPPDAAVSDIGDRPSWWQRLLGGGVMPWSAALATVLVATLVTMVWQREPVPGAGRESDEAYVAVAPRPPAQPPAAPAPPPAPESPIPSLLPGLASPPPPLPEAPAEPPAETSESPQARAAQRAAERAERAQAAKDARAKAAESAAAPAPLVDAVPRPAPPDAFAARGRSETEAPAPGGSVAAIRPPGRPAASDAGAGATDRAPPTFAALAQWNRITIARPGGESRSLPRSEAPELSALLGSAALAAVGAQPLAGSPEWSLMLERNGQVLAVLEVTGRQVRWREGGTPPATGAPSAPALAALREALRATMKPPEQAAQPQTRPEPQPQPQPRQAEPLPRPQAQPEPEPQPSPEPRQEPQRSP